MGESSQTAEIKIFTSPYCGACRTAKAYLSSKGIKFQELDVSTNQEMAAALFQITNQNSIPVILFGETGKFVVGFNRGLIDKYLEDSRSND